MTEPVPPDAVSNLVPGTSAQEVRLQALKLAVKIGDPDRELAMAELLINADALVRYMYGVDRNVIMLEWRDAMERLHQEGRTAGPGQGNAAEWQPSDD